MTSPANQPHVMVVDDDGRLRELLRRYLTNNGYRVTTAASAAEAAARLRSLTFDLLVVDVMMPGQSGIDFTRELTGAAPVPVLVVTALDEPADRLNGFDAGAADYLAKPFDPRELLIRIGNILARQPSAAPAEPETPRFVVFSPYRFDFHRQELTSGEAPVPLTATERSLLDRLCRRAGRGVSREELGGEGDTRTVDVQVTRLRRKLETDPKNPRFLQTVRGEGYRLVVDP